MIKSWDNSYIQNFHYDYVSDFNWYSVGEKDKNSQNINDMMDISKSIFEKYNNQDLKSGGTHTFFSSGDDISKQVTDSLKKQNLSNDEMSEFDNNVFNLFDKPQNDGGLSYMVQNDLLEKKDTKLFETSMLNPFGNDKKIGVATIRQDYLDTDLYKNFEPLDFTYKTISNDKNTAFTNFLSAAKSLGASDEMLHDKTFQNEIQFAFSAGYAALDKAHNRTYNQYEFNLLNDDKKQQMAKLTGNEARIYDGETVYYNQVDRNKLDNIAQDSIDNPKTKLVEQESKTEISLNIKSKKELQEFFDTLRKNITKKYSDPEYNNLLKQNLKIIDGLEKELFKTGTISDNKIVDQLYA